MAAYMRKTGILPVCTNNEARDYFAGKGLTYADVTEGDIVFYCTTHGGNQYGSDKRSHSTD